MLYSILRLFSLLILKVLFRLKVRGREYIPKRGAFILASNHVSYLDPVAVGVACPRKLNFMAKDDLFINPWSSRFFSDLGVFAVKRDSADLSALKDAMRRLNNGEALVIFPEGSRSVNGKFFQPQAGIGFLAAKLNVPVIPAFVKGTERALPKGAKFLKPAKISVCFGKEIPIERRMPYQDIARSIMENIRHLSCSLSN